MTWKHRSDGSWSTATLKVRKGGQWVSLGSGGGGSGGESSEIPSRFYTETPTRSTTITYDSSNFASIQDAIYSLNPDEELYIPTDTYSESITLDSSVADHITIRGDLELSYDTNGRASVSQEGPTIQSTGNVFETDQQFFSSDASLAASLNGCDSLLQGGETEISVTDASPFSVGDIIYLYEDTTPYGEPASSGGSGGAEQTREFRRVAAVDTSTDTLTVENPVLLPYPNDNSTSVGVYSPTVEDIRISGIRFDGNGGVTRPVRFYSIVDGWFDNIISRNIQAGSSNKDPLIAARKSFHCRFDKYHVEIGDQYGLNLYDSCTDIAVTQASSYNHDRYTCRIGRTSNPSSGYYIDGVTGEDLTGRSVFNAHHGGFHADVYNVTSFNSVITSLRSWYTHVNGITKHGTDDTGADFQFAQRPNHQEIRNAHISKDSSSSGSVFQFRVRGENSPYGDEHLFSVLIENFEIDDYGPAITDIGYFEGSGDVHDLTFRNVTYGGQDLTKSDVEQWNGYDTTNFVNPVTVE